MDGSGWKDSCSRENNIIIYEIPRQHPSQPAEMIIPQQQQKRRRLVDGEDEDDEEEEEKK